MTTLIQSRLLATANGKYIGILTLNNPKALNAQNLEMVSVLSEYLSQWQDDDSVAMVVLHGTGDRALCAGGDIKSLQSASIKDVERFFDKEYGLMYQMHTYAKPILAWGNGVVMGGGLGLLASSSHKVVTQSTMMAMPEVSIGLFPDAGGSYFLNRMMAKVGLFLGLTGARFTGMDALYLGLADFAVAHEKFDEVLSGLTQIRWQDDRANHHLLSAFLHHYHDNSILTQGYILPNFNTIAQLMNAGDLLAVDKALGAYQGDNAWLLQSIETYQKGSAITKALTWRIYHQVATWSLAEIFAMEKTVAVQCVTKGDFKEGVRALLIDKDKNPNWQYTLETLPDGYVDGFLLNERGL